MIPQIMMKIQKISYGKECSFHGIPIIVKDNRSTIQIGNGCRIRSGVLTNLIGLYQRTMIVAKEGAVIKIGDDVGMSGVTIYARNAITIGAKTLIGANAKILDNDFHPVDPAIRRQTPGEYIESEPIEIGENVFIGCNVLVLKGVKIGNNSVIGAGSVVTTDIPANCVAAGNPAKVVKKI